LHITSPRILVCVYYVLIAPSRAGTIMKGTSRSL